MTGDGRQVRILVHTTKACFIHWCIILIALQATLPCHNAQAPQPSCHPAASPNAMHGHQLLQLWRPALGHFFAPHRRRRLPQVQAACSCGGCGQPCRLLLSRCLVSSIASEWIGAAEQLQCELCIALQVGGKKQEQRVSVGALRRLCAALICCA